MKYNFTIKGVIIIKTCNNSKEHIVKPLNRIEGQIRGIKNMVENGKNCSDILTQVSAKNKKGAIE